MFHTYYSIIKETLPDREKTHYIYIQCRDTVYHHLPKQNTSKEIYPMNPKTPTKGLAQSALMAVLLTFALTLTAAGQAMSTPDTSVSEYASNAQNLSEPADAMQNKNMQPSTGTTDSDLVQQVRRSLESTAVSPLKPWTASSKYPAQSERAVKGEILSDEPMRSGASMRSPPTASLFPIAAQRASASICMTLPLPQK